MAWTVKRFCRMFYDLGDEEEPTKAQQNTIARMCGEGTLKAFKFGRKWFIEYEQSKRRTNV